MIDGLTQGATRRVDLSDLFSGRVDGDGNTAETYAIVRPLPSPAQAEIQEVAGGNVRYVTDSKTGKMTTYRAITREMLVKIRALKVLRGVTDHNLPKNGKVARLSEDYIAEVDDLNSDVFDRIVEAVDDMSQDSEEYVERDKLVDWLRNHEDAELSLDDVAEFFRGNSGPT